MPPAWRFPLLPFSSLDFLIAALREKRIEPGEADGLLARLDSGPQIRRSLTAHGNPWKT